MSLFVEHNPDFSEQYTLTYANKTAIYSSIYGYEQRASTRQNPRVMVTYTIKSGGTDIYKRRMEAEKELVNDYYLPLVCFDMTVSAPNTHELRVFPWSLRHFREGGYVRVLIDSDWVYKSILSIDYDAQSLILDDNSLPETGNYNVMPVVRVRRDGDSFNFEDLTRSTRIERISWKEVI